MSKFANNTSSNNIIKKDIVKHLYHKVGLSQKELSSMLDDLFLLMGYALIKDKKVLINNFGNFSVRKTNKRVVYNPKTKQPHQIKAHNVVKFQPSRNFRTYLTD